jgi:hypothetical protein
MTVESPVSEGATLPVRYTCTGADISLPLKWSSVPRNTVEIDVFVLQLEPSGNEPAAWAVAGLPPTLTHLAAGHLPAGAIVGRNRFGQTRYSVCPAPKTAGNYVVLVDPLPKRIPVKPGFEAEPLANQVVTTAESEGETTFRYGRQ